MASIPGPVWLIIGLAVAGMSKLGPMRDEAIFKFFFYIGILFFIIGIIKIIIPNEKKTKNRLNSNNQNLNGFNPFKSPEEQGISIDSNNQNSQNFQQNNQGINNYGNLKQKTRQKLNNEFRKENSQVQNNIIYCPMCNTRNLSKSRFCHMCGSKLN